MPEFRENGTEEFAGKVAPENSTRRPRRRRNPIASNSARSGNSAGQKCQIGPCAVDATTFGGEKCADGKKPCDAVVDCDKHSDGKYSTAVVGGSGGESRQKTRPEDRQFRRKPSDRRQGRWSGGRGGDGSQGRRGDGEEAAKSSTGGVLGKIFRAVWPFGRQKSQPRGNSTAANSTNFNGRPRHRGGRGRRPQQ
ncbi:MAG: hypothetical protein LBB38_01165 [Puniceicoccales bacterium]|nr:hypothetical protein [Puniceicoccales bacterium]